jgi:hypothetical protein
MFIHELVLHTLPRVVNLLASIHLKITKNRKKRHMVKLRSLIIRMEASQGIYETSSKIRYNQLSLSIGVHDKEEKGELKKMRR